MIAQRPTAIPEVQVPAKVEAEVARFEAVAVPTSVGWIDPSVNGELVNALRMFRRARQQVKQREVVNVR